MAAVADFLRFVLPYAPTAAQISVQRYLVDSAIELCQKTGIWREVLDELNVRAGQPEVELDLPPDSQLFQITEVYFDGQKVDPVPPDDLVNKGDDWFTKQSSRPYGFYSTNPTALILVPAPEESRQRALKVFAKLMPTRNAQVLPDLLLDRYPEVVACGALARLLMEPDQAYSNQQMAMTNAEMFEVKSKKIAQEAQKGFARSKFRTKPYFM